MSHHYYNTDRFQIERPKKVSRLKQLSKSNRLMRRYYASAKVTTPVLAQKKAA